MSLRITGDKTAVRRLSNLPSGQAMTIVLFAKQVTQHATYSSHIMYVQDSGGLSASEVVVEGGSSLLAYDYYGTSNTPTVATVDNLWAGVALRTNGTGAGAAKVYHKPINGSVSSQTMPNTLASTLEVILLGDAPFAPGSFGIDAFWFDGLIAHVKIYNRALSDAEVAAELAAGAPVSTTDLISYHSFVGSDVSAAMTPDQGTGTFSYYTSAPTISNDNPNFTPPIEMASARTGTLTAVAALSTTRPIAAATAGAVTAAAAALTTQVRMAATPSGVLAGSGSMATGIRAAAVVSGALTASPVLSAPITLAAVRAASLVSAASLTTSVRLGATANFTASLYGVLPLVSQLFAAARGSLTQMSDWDVVLTGAALRAAIGDPSKYDAAARGWIIPGRAGASVSTIARSSVAWQLRADGSYEVAPHNLLLGSYEVTTANGWTKGPNITEGGLSGTLNGWPAYLYTSTAASNSFVNRSITVEVGCTYTVRFWCTHTGAGWVTMGTTNRAINYTKTLLSAGLYEWTATFTAAATETTAAILVGVVDAANGTAWRVSAPQVCIGSVACAHVPTHDAAAFSAAINWTAADGGAYEIESDEARTQLWTHSAAMATGGFGTGANLAANGPDGTLAGFPAFRYTSAAAGNSFLTQDVSGVTAGTTYTASFIADFGPSTLGSGARYLVTTPSGTQHAYTATQLAANVWEWSVTFTIPTGDNYLFGLIGNVDGGAGTTWRIAQPQFVLGARKPGKIVSWGAATVTRAADTTVIPDTPSRSFISGDAGTLLVHYRRDSIVPADTYPGVAEINWDDNNRVLVAAQPGAIADIVMQIRNGGTPSVSTGHSGAAAGLHRIVASWSAARADASQDGATAVSDTSVVLPSTASAPEIRVGRVDHLLAGSIRELRYRSASYGEASGVVALAGGQSVFSEITTQVRPAATPSATLQTAGALQTAIRVAAAATISAQASVNQFDIGNVLLASGGITGIARAGARDLTGEGRFGAFAYCNTGDGPTSRNRHAAKYATPASVVARR